MTHHLVRTHVLAALLAVGTVLGGQTLLSSPARSQTPSVAPTPAPVQAAPVMTVTLPPPGQALVHEFTTSTGAVCTVVLTATSSDPHAVCGTELGAPASPAH